MNWPFIVGVEQVLFLILPFISLSARKFFRRFDQIADVALTTSIGLILFYLFSDFERAVRNYSLVIEDIAFCVLVAFGVFLVLRASLHEAMK